MPGLDVIAIEPGAPPRAIATVSFEGKGDDPSRLTLSASGTRAAVTLEGSNTVAAIDLLDPARPQLIGRAPLATAPHPYPSRSRDDWILMPVAEVGESVVLHLAGLGDCVASALPRGSGVELYHPDRRASLGTLLLRGGALGLSKTRPTGLAVSPERGLLAAADRSGGVHMITIRPQAGPMATRALTPRGN